MVLWHKGRLFCLRLPLLQWNDCKTTVVGARMPAVASLSEFNRNQSAVIDRFERSQEPMYLTRNGKASVVVMDADAFDRMMGFKAEVHQREMAVYDGLLRGYQDVSRCITLLIAKPNV